MKTKCLRAWEIICIRCRSLIAFLCYFGTKIIILLYSFSPINGCYFYTKVLVTHTVNETAEFNMRTFSAMEAVVVFFCKLINDS